MITQMIIWGCDECDQVQSESYGIFPDPMNHLLLPVPPEGWRMLDGKVYCPRHAIQIKVWTPHEERDSTAYD